MDEEKYREEGTLPCQIDEAFEGIRIPGVRNGLLLL